MKLILARYAARLERAVDRFRTPQIARRIDPYIGYATPENLIVRGRVLANPKAVDATVGQSRWRNFRQMVALFATDEVAGVTVTANGVTAVSDEEGYFTIILPRGDATGIVNVTVKAGEISTLCPVLVPDPAAPHGVISDIDDTMMRTGAYSLWRNVWTSMTGNALTRDVFADAVTLMKILGAGNAPVFFVSSSPWNFHGFLRDTFARAGLPFAPMFLRDYGVSETQFITGTHGDHKGSAIDVIMAAASDTMFILIGDTGQHDAVVYRDAIARHPDRIKHVILRAAGRVDAHDRDIIAAIRATGVPVTVGVDYSQAIALFREAPNATNARHHI